MRNQTWTGLFFLLFSLMAGTAQAQTCHPESIPASTPDSQLQDNGDGTITDLKTGLMWKQCLEGQSGSDCASGSVGTWSWQQALQRVQTVNSSGGFAGFSDWRLPNIKELSSLVELQCQDPAINLTRFPNTSSGGVWSSSAVAGNTGGAWYVYFGYGFNGLDSKDLSSQLRLVRSVNSGPDAELIGTYGPIRPVSPEPLPAQDSTTSGLGDNGVVTNPEVGNFN